MKILTLGAAAMAALIAGCAASPELVSCLQPNRRVAVEVSGIKVKPPAKPGGKAGRQNVLLKAMAQGDLAWDAEEAVLKKAAKKRSINWSTPLIKARVATNGPPKSARSSLLAIPTASNWKTAR